MNPENQSEPACASHADRREWRIISLEVLQGAYEHASDSEIKSLIIGLSSPSLKHCKSCQAALKQIRAGKRKHAP